MIWFGSSAGVALANMYPEAKSVGRWVRHGWPIAVAYVVGFFVMLAMIGWHHRMARPQAWTVGNQKRLARPRRPSQRPAGQIVGFQTTGISR